MRLNPVLSKKLFTRIALLQTSVMTVVLVILGFTIRSKVRDVYLDGLNTELSGLVEILFRQIPDPVTPEWCSTISDKTQFRISIISSVDGAVICDNAFPLGTFPSLLDRPEVQDAIHSANRHGFAVRASRVMQDLERIYTAVYNPERKLLLRAGLPLTDLQTAMKTFDQLFLVSIAILGIILTVILQWTARKVTYVKAKEAVNRSRRQMQEDLIANVSHEFRTPLTSIRGFAGTALSDLRAGRNVDPEFIDIIVKDSDRLLGMVNTLLDFAAIDSGSLQIAEEEIFLPELTDDALKRLQIIYGQKKQEIGTQFEVTSLTGDPDRILQVLINLIGNSMNYCPPGSRILVQWSRPEESIIQLVIEDNGPGIPNESRDRIFERFVRGTDATQGSGLGLPIVKELVELHGGTITMSSEEGKGTRFQIRFPQGQARQR